MFGRKKDDETKDLREQVEKLKEQLNELSKQIETEKEEPGKEETLPQPQPKTSSIRVSTGKPTEYTFDFAEFGERMGEFGVRISEYVNNIVEGVMKNVMTDLDRSLVISSHKPESEGSPEKETVKADPKTAADLMSALSHENRITILGELVSGGRYASELQEKLPDIGASTLSSHLDVLEKAGLIVQEKARGRYLITMSGRLAYQMANEISKQAEEASL
jgi:DNA-binding transcriptional ArsR family regulator